MRAQQCARMPPERQTQRAIVVRNGLPLRERRKRRCRVVRASRTEQIPVRHRGECVPQRRAAIARKARQVCIMPDFSTFE
ncbi:unnamed protein product (plasmid) [Mycetohabitans rhizoxinica HKI 454]|uniref:Uncharacterized protein n=1 Tax=Mycetohabitans rhizoxinica (strain DSM 19002 / CIP 109453 / HKI 454) TaxID=882378 RepID=E5AV44_MYCRK|nr:unnamed protein product [Mycetohabitans rhizoxinica HKI 454]